MPLSIPRVFHQIWVGPNPLPEPFQEYQATWLEHHPGWELRLWTEDSLPHDLRRPEARDRLRAGAERADILRLEVLWRHGGVYVDTDFECRRSLEPLLDGVEIFAARIGEERVNNALVGSVPGHPILDRALDELRPREFYGYDKAAAGPEFLDLLLRDYPEVTIFDSELFYPETPEALRSAYAVHHAARSWVQDDGLRARLEKAERRAEKAQQQELKTQQELRAVLAGWSPLRRLARLASGARSAR